MICTRLSQSPAPYEHNEGHITYDMGESDGEHDVLSDTTHTCRL